MEWDFRWLYITAVFTDHQNGSYDYLDFYISSMKWVALRNE